MTRRRASRYRRPDTVPVVHLTPDDEAILWHVARHRLIDGAMLYDLFPHRSEQKFSKRLRDLYRAGFLERIEQHARRRPGGGSYPLIYALARQGARHLQTTYGSRVNPSRLTQKNAELKAWSIEHTLATTRFMVGLERAARKRDGAGVDYFDQLAAEFPEARYSSTGLPYTLRTHIDWKGKRGEVGTAPDQIFRLMMPGGSRYLFLEIDRATETIAPADGQHGRPEFWRNSSILKKLLIYAAAANPKRKPPFGLPGFQVLMVTESPGRAAAMQAAYQQHLTKGTVTAKPNVFLFTDWQSIEAGGGDVLAAPIRNGLGKEFGFYLG